MVPESVLAELLAETEGPLARAELDLRLLEDHIARLRSERYGLQLALARRRGGEVPPVDTMGGADPAPRTARPTGSAAAARAHAVAPWPALSRAEAVERVLREAAEPLTRLDVVDRLQASGRSGDDPDAVSAALAYLQRVGRAGRMGRGRWTPAAQDGERSGQDR